jgi:hypothetical protein
LPVKTPALAFFQKPEIFDKNRLLSRLSHKKNASSKCLNGFRLRYYIGGINRKSVLMKLKIDFIEIARFLICVGIAWIGYMYMWHTGSLL